MLLQHIEALVKGNGVAPNGGGTQRAAAVGKSVFHSDPTPPSIPPHLGEGRLHFARGLAVSPKPIGFTPELVR